MNNPLEMARTLRKEARRPYPYLSPDDRNLMNQAATELEFAARKHQFTAEPTGSLKQFREGAA